MRDPDDPLDLVARVRALRVQLAEGEAQRARQALARAQRLLDDARRQKAEYETLASSMRGGVLGETVRASDMQRRLEFSDGARFLAAECVGIIRRAELARERVEEDTEEARAEWRRRVLQHGSVAREVDKRHRVRRAHHLEVESETANEDHAMVAVALSALREGTHG